VIKQLHVKADIMFSDRDRYEPIDDESASLVKRDRRIKTGFIGAVAALAVVTGVVHFSKSDRSAQTGSTDNLFSSLLMDEKGFFFPTALPNKTNPSSRHRHLKAKETNKLEENGVPPSPSWGCNWKDNIGAYSAIGEYYQAKGMALGDYYRSKYDVGFENNAFVLF
jgi:hypothetical protein